MPTSQATLSPPASPGEGQGEGKMVGFQIASYDPKQPLIIDPVLSYSTYLGGSNDEGVSGLAVDSAGNAYVTGGTQSTDFPTTPGAFDRTCGSDGRCNRTFFSRSDVFITKLNPTGTALVYSTYLGGSGGEGGAGIAVDSTGNAYVTGSTISTDFPTTAGAFDRTCGSDGTCNSNEITGFSSDGFVTKLAPAGDALLYSTYLGGNRRDEVVGIVVDSAGNAYMTGETESPDFPTTFGAFDRTCGSDGTCNLREGQVFGRDDAFVTKLNAAGTALVYSTYLGGRGEDRGQGIALGSVGNAYVTGNTFSTDFPTVDPFQATFGGSGVSGGDVFVTKLNTMGTGLVYSTYLGGRNSEGSGDIAVDSVGNAYLVGFTLSTNFPTTPGTLDQTCGSDGQCDFDRSEESELPIPDAFITKLTPTGNALVYSTFLGGGNFDSGSAIAVDSAGNAYVAGATGSFDFPTVDAFQPTFIGGPEGRNFDAFVSKLNAAGSALVYSSFLGGSDNDGGGTIAVDSTGNAYVVGGTFSTDFPTTPGAFQRTFGGNGNTDSGDGFITKITASTPLCAGLPATMVGTDRDDVIYGTPGPDIIQGRDGNDYINGRGGNDVICGGPGSDLLIGRGVNDVLRGGRGDDTLYAGRGNDLLRGGKGNDRLFGNGQDDVLNGGADTDTCDGDGPNTPNPGFADSATHCETVINVP